MKTSRITKAEIARVLRTQNSTEIFKICSKLGLDVSVRKSVYDFIRENAPSAKVYRNAYRLSYGAGDFKNYRIDHSSVKMPIKAAVDHAKYNKNRGYDNYSKKLILGNTNIYWASPVYEHSDYNKSVAFPNTEKFRKIASLINKFLNY